MGKHQTTPKTEALVWHREHSKNKNETWHAAIDPDTGDLYEILKYQKHWYALKAEVIFLVAGVDTKKEAIKACELERKEHKHWSKADGDEPLPESFNPWKSASRQLRERDLECFVTPFIPPLPVPLPIHPSVTGQATWSEIEDAVRGWLRPRVIMGSFNQDIRSPSFIGLETGLPIALAWCWVFQENEKRQIPDRQTDSQLLEQMLDDFPGMAFKMDVNIVRWKYNTGALTRGLVPIRKSHRYDDNGRVISAGWKGAVRRSVNRQKYSLQLKKEFEKCIELNEFVREFVHKPRIKPTPLFEARP